MLAKAKNIVTTEVMEWLKKNYACHISPLPIPSPTFHSVIKTWVTTLFELAPLEDELVKGKWTEWEKDVIWWIWIAPSRNVQHSLEIEYVVHDLKELANITLKLKIPEVIKMCKRLKDPKDFIFALQDHILHITQINVGALAIGKLTTTNMGLDKEGRLKVRDLKENDGRLMSFLDIWSYFKNGCSKNCMRTDWISKYKIKKLF